MKSASPEESMGKARPTLTDLLRARTAFIIEPIVNFLARYRLGPDALTVAGLVTHLLFAWLIATGQMTAAGIAIALISPLDALDGALARKLGRSREGFGAFLDSTLDRFAEIVLFGGFIYYYLQLGDTLWLGVAYAAVTGSLMVSYTRARAEALGYECKVGILTRVERYVVLIVFLILNLPAVALAILAFFTYVTAGQRMLHMWRQTREG